MSRKMQSQYSKNIKLKQITKNKQGVVGRVTKLPSGQIASKALRERGRSTDGQ